MATRVRKPGPPKLPKPDGIGSRYQDHMVGAGHFLRSALNKLDKQIGFTQEEVEKSKLYAKKKWLVEVLGRVEAESK